MLTLNRIVALAILLALHGSVLAWGAVGHMSVGTVADQLIAGTNAAKHVRQVLGTTLRTAAVWADCAKGVSDSTFKYSGDGKYPECAVYENNASKAQMVSYVKRNATNCERPEGAEICHKQYHYTDVALQESTYKKGLVGTSDHDIESAISAAIAVLEGKKSPEPFQFNSKKEALRVLSHLVGDIHQPLHVAAVYLNAQGQEIDPDQGTFDPSTETHGANDILLGSTRLHALWDNVPASLSAEQLLPAALQEARDVRPTSGPIADWPQIWATETLGEGKKAFHNLSYSTEDARHHFGVTLPAGYDEFRADIQRTQILRAGARLAQILKTIWP